MEIKKIKIGLYSSFSLLILLGILIVINVLSLNLFKRFDLTQGKVYTLSPASINLVKGLKDPLIIKAYFTKNLPPPHNIHGKYLRDLLEEYRTYSHGKVRYEFIDPADNERLKEEVEAAGIPPLKFTTVERDKFEVKEGYMGIVFMHEERREVLPLIQQTTGLEYDLSSRMKKLTMTVQPRVGFLTGHGEVNIFQEEELYARIASHYGFEMVDLKEKPEALDEVDCLIILGPKSPVSEEERYRIDQFLMKGKSIAFLLDHMKVDLQMFEAHPLETGLEKMLEHYGIKIEKGFVLDYQCQRVGVAQRRGAFTVQNIVEYPFFPLATQFNYDNPMVRELSQVSFPYISPLKINIPASIEGEALAQGETLVISSPHSWHSKEISSVYPLEQYYPQANDPKGPLILAAALKGRFNSFFPDREGAQKTSFTSRIVAIGNSGFISRQFPADLQHNYTFFLNMIDWLLEDEALISIRSKGVVYRPLKEISPAKKQLIKYGNIFLLPLGLFIYGLVRWRMRLRKKARLAILYTK